MPSLSSSTTLLIGAGSPGTDSIDIPILPAASTTSGMGRLIHPTLGTLDYTHAPDEWSGIDGDAIIPPVWATSKTLSGAANTLWRGTLRDVAAGERWFNDPGLSMPLTLLRSLIAFWQNPPDPATGYLEWWPNYTTALGFYIVFSELKVGDQGINLDYISRQGYITGAVSTGYRIVGRIA